MPLNVDKISTGSLSINGTEVIPSAPQLYKVYTVLLTQSGGDDPLQHGPGDGSLTIGITYEIGGASVIGSWDFSNVGGPIYPETYPFVATASEEPNSWVGISELNYNTGAPVVTVLENTLGYNITWEYANIGVYKSLGIVGTFEGGKFGLIQGAGNSSSLVSLWGYNSSMDFSEMLLECYDLGNVSSPSGLQLKDDILVNQLIEIRVYN
jgi:hypothetical protein